MSYAVIDRAAGTLTCARAGHTPFMRIAAGDTRVEVLAPDGMVLGLNLDRGERFERYLEELTLPIAGGDLFFFYRRRQGSDERRRRMFGESRLSTFWRKMPPRCPRRFAMACWKKSPPSSRDSRSTTILDGHRQG